MATSSSGLSPPPSVRTIKEAERPKAIATLALAFVTDPLSRWIVPDADLYLGCASEFIDAFGGPGIGHRAGFATDNFEGVALWLPPGVDSDSERMAAVVASATPADRLDAANAVFEQMAEFHPHEAHWYLPIIGVDPVHQGRGHGGALMKHVAARCDADGVLSYLESSNPRNIPLYERHGFEVLGSIQVGGSPIITPMLRVPR